MDNKIAGSRIILYLQLISILQAGNLWQLDSLITGSLAGSNLHPGVDYAMEGISLATPFIEWGSVIALHGTVWDNQDRSLQHFTQLTTAGLVATQVGVGLLKYAFKRNRPDRHYQPRLWNTRITPSFPSGHTASSAVFASIVAHKYPSAKSLLVLYFLTSAYSQLYVGNHYASDVLGGAILGGLVGRLLVRDQNSSPASPALIYISLPLN